MSAEPPGGAPTTIRTGRAGYACALAERGKAGSAAAPAARCRNRRRGILMALPPLTADNATRCSCKKKRGRGPSSDDRQATPRRPDTRSRRGDAQDWVPDARRFQRVRQAGDVSEYGLSRLVRIRPPDFHKAGEDTQDVAGAACSWAAAPLSSPTGAVKSTRPRSQGKPLKRRPRGGQPQQSDPLPRGTYRGELRQCGPQRGRPQRRGPQRRGPQRGRPYRVDPLWGEAHGNKP
jgi:hypothetical protein